MIKIPIYQEAIIILNKCMPNERASIYLKQRHIARLKPKGEKTISQLISWRFQHSFLSI